MNQKLTKIAKEYMFLCLWLCRKGCCKNGLKTHQIDQKRARVRKSQPRSKLGFLKVKDCSRKWRLVLVLSWNTNFSPLIKLWKLADFIPQDSNITQKSLDPYHSINLSPKLKTRSIYHQAQGPSKQNNLVQHHDPSTNPLFNPKSNPLYPSQNF